MGHIVYDWPLAICDARSVPPEGLVEVDQVRPGRVGHSMFLQYSQGLRWSYLHHQEPHEVWLFKQFDSAESIEARCESLRSSSLWFLLRAGHPLYEIEKIARSMKLMPHLVQL